MSITDKRCGSLWTYLPLVFILVVVLLTETNGRPQYQGSGSGWDQSVNPTMEQMTPYQRFPEDDRTYIVMVDDPIVVIVPNSNATEYPPGEEQDPMSSIA